MPEGLLSQECAMQLANKLILLTIQSNFMHKFSQFGKAVKKYNHLRNAVI